MARDGVPAVSRSQRPRRLESVWCWRRATRVSCMRQRSQDERSASSLRCLQLRRAAQGLPDPYLYCCGLLLHAGGTACHRAGRYNDINGMPAAGRCRTAVDMRISIWPRCMTCPASRPCAFLLEKHETWLISERPVVQTAQRPVVIRTCQLSRRSRPAKLGPGRPLEQAACPASRP